MSDRLCVDGRTYDRFHVVHNGDPGAGFSALMTYALNGLRRADARNWLAVVNYDGTSTPHFYDPARGENVWDYYFEPLAGVSYRDLMRWVERGEVSSGTIHRFSDREVVDWHVHDPERITTFWGPDLPADRTTWMAANRQRGRNYVSRHLRPRAHILDRVDALAPALVGSAFTFGVHIRGTDFNYARPTYPQDYFRVIDARAAVLGLGEFKVFVATDQAQFLDAFERHYPGRVTSYDAARSSNDVAPFQLDDVAPYKKGEDVLMDVLLLARTDYLLKSVSAVGEYALWFNPELECTDFALESDFEPKPGVLWPGVYLKMDPDGKGALRMRLLAWTRTAQAIAAKVWARVRRVRGLTQRR